VRWPALFAVALTAVIVRPHPTPSPIQPPPKPSPIASARPSPKPSTSPSPKTSPTPRRSPSPSPLPPVLNCATSSIPAAPPQTPAFAGNLQLQGVFDAVAVSRAGPASMLPPQLGRNVLVAVQITKPEDTVSSVLQDALTKGTVIPCALLGLGQGTDFTYARYAFRKVQVIGLQSSLDSNFKMQETFTLTYESVQWQYLLTGSTTPVSGQGPYGAGRGSAAPATGAGPPPWLWLAGFLAILLAIAGGWARFGRS